ncbi:facilitated trehalose transporter Tret1-like [Mycetomoellerius zeteki]|uniref:facilitated trehalose transporter Tret1-like n=1 Tax=Mycetomoellerius zeteki TaxID=64791 RepID=UPI00084E49E9|nr:PREDICTED: facilitated trehalose transporter Tret1-like [Trachymyrmex zeteki]
MAKKIFEPLLQLWPQWFATLTVALSTINIGLANGWTSPYLAQLTDENALFRVTDEEASWIASLLPLGRLLGAIIGPLILEYVGSKMSILSTGLPMIVSWICIIFATSPTWLYVSRILSGTAMGMIVSSYPLYIGEISAPSIRGALACLIMNGFPLGIFFGIIIGWMGIFAIDRYGRRLLLAISSLGVMIGMVLLGLHFFLLDYGYDSNHLEWLIILSLVLIMMMYFGLVPVPITILSEIFPSDLKSLAGFFGSITSAAFAFLASRTYQPLVDLISEKYVFWIYAMIIMMSLIYALTMLPETKGKTLQEIQDMMTAKSATKRSQQETHE